jgi:thioesterase-3
MRHHSEFEIRTFHTDAFGHVNNARYLEILEEARWRYAEQIGLVPLLRDSQLGFIIIDLQIRFRSPVAEGDSIAVTTRLVSLGTSCGEVLQTVCRKSEPNRIATRCLSHFILIERASGRSIPIDGNIRKLLENVVHDEKGERRTKHLLIKPKSSQAETTS